jgi:hypothetical protein
MGKLHQVLAVEKDVKNKFQKIVTECKETFCQRGKLFNEHRKTYQPLVQDDSYIPGSQEYEPMQSTVRAKLNYVESSMIQAMDILFQKERANSTARADVEIDNGDGTKKTLIKDVPVTALVQLENLVEDVRTRVYDSIPTLDPAKIWHKDDTTPDTWKADPVQTQSTKKNQEALVLFPATDKHPAQCQMIVVDRPAGTWTVSTRSGCLSPLQKSQLLDRLEKLIAGIKIARSKANDIEVDSVAIGKIFFNYINEGLKE